MKLLKKYKSRIGSWLIFSFILQVTSPLVAALQLQPYRTLAQVQSVHVPELQSHNIADSGVNELIKLIINDAADAQKAGIAVEVPEPLKKCHALLCDGNQELPASLLWEALPTLLDYAWQLEQTKAPRPSALPKAPVVGPGVCDFTQVYAGLQAIRDRIGCIGEGCDVSCNSVLGILGDACSILGCSIACTLTSISSSSSAAILEKITEIESTLTTCCTQLQADITEVSSAQAACCAEIINDINITTSLILEALDNIGGSADNCDCDFFITQVANGEPKNHPITDPITQSGVYCLAEDVSGTIVINPGVNNVTILFRGHVLTAVNYGITATDSNHIYVSGGTIQNAAVSAINIQNGFDSRITNMTFISNSQDIGLQGTFPSTYVEGAVVNNCQFDQTITTALNIFLCRNSSVTNCVLRNAQGDADMTLVALSGCEQFTFENISIIDNILALRLAVIEARGIYNSSFKNIHVTNNTARISFIGILLRNSDNNTIADCSFNNNSVTYNSNLSAVGQFYGIQISKNFVLADYPTLCNNNSVVRCQINGNSIANTVAPSGDFPSLFVGIDIGRTANPLVGPVPPGYAFSDTLIEDCSVCNNSNVSFVESTTQQPAVMMGINVGGAISNEEVLQSVGVNAVVSNCAINNNLSSTHFIGINLASIIRGTSAPVPSINASSCQNATINNCTINANSVRGEYQPNPCFAGVAVASVLGGSGTISASCAQSCSINNCTVNNNILDDLAPTSGPEFFVGFMVGSAVSLSGEGAVLFDTATGCTLEGCSVNNNTYDIAGRTSALFAGFKMGSIFALVQNASIGARTCANSSLRNCAVNSNTNIIADTPAYSVFLGYDIGSIEHLNPGGEGPFNTTVGVGVCQNSTLENCTFNANTNGLGTSTTGFNVGSTITATDVGTVLTQVNACDNVSLIGCSVNDNVATIADRGTMPILVGVALSANCALLDSSFALTDDACNNFLLRDVTINSNTLNITDPDPTPNTLGFLVGVTMGGSSDVILRSGGGCNNGVLERVTVSNNSMLNTDGAGYLRGFTIKGLTQTASTGGRLSNNITATGCMVEGNSVTKDGAFAGFYVDGTGPVNAAGGCDNLVMRGCEVNGNSAALSTAQGYNIVNTSSVNVAVNNAQLNGCVARGNSGVFCPGFNFEKTPNALVADCLSVMNTGTGFVLRDVVDSFFQQCQAISNQGHGFEFAGTTNNVGIINSEALNNTVDGFALAETTTSCHIRDNVAQNQIAGFGFNNEDNDDWKHQFINNYAQANTAANYSTGIPLVVAPIAATNAFSNIDG